MDISTEEKIKAAAEKVFMEKGFSGARTRDIADEAGINLALLNYYFRSKENLFGIVMMEKLKVFFDVIIDILKDTDIPLPEKLTKLVNRYTDLLTNEPHLPIFLLSELKQNPDFFAEKLNVKERLNEGALQLLLENNFQNKQEAMQLLISFLGMMLFPFVVQEALQKLFDISAEEYHEMLNERRRLIPVWMGELIKTERK